MHESTPASPLARFLVIQVVRYIAATQCFAMVFFHAGWILLAVATWAHLGGPDSAIGALTRVFVSAFAWLGGVDSQGQGDGSTLMIVWAKIALAIYLVEALWRRLYGAPRPVGLGRIAVVSWLIAQAGYVVAILPTGGLAESMIVLVLFPILAAVSTVWAVAMHRLAKLVEDRINSNPGNAVAQRP